MQPAHVYRTAPVLAFLAVFLGVPPWQTEAGRPERPADDNPFVEVVRSVQPVVVSISVNRPRGYEFAVDRKRRRSITGYGSGVVIDSAGHVLTNHHVVEDAVAIRVMLSDTHCRQGAAEIDADVVGQVPSGLRDVLPRRIRASSRPTLPSTPGTAAARWSICRARQ